MSKLIGMTPSPIKNYSGKKNQSFLFLDIKSETKSLIETAPLQIERVRELFNRSGRYPILFNQEHVKIYYLIAYTKEKREGAEAEANELEDAFAAIGGKIVKKEWSTTTELVTDIKNKLATAKDTDSCSCFFLSVMCHGRMGMLYQSDFKGFITIDDLLLQLTNGLHPETPLV